jgi:tripartite-type tricarboxylate transporter receptor subunit TctC
MESLARAARCLGVYLLIAVTWLPSAQAQDFPTKPIRIVSAFTAGGANDVIARMIAQQLSERLGQAVIVENRGGAGGTLGAALVAKAEPDGHTLLMIALAHAAHPSLFRELPYDVEKDFVPVAMVAAVPLALTVDAKLRLRSLKDFIDLAKSKPGELNYGSGGNGTSQHLAMEMLLMRAGAKMLHVPYKGIPEVVGDLIGGRLTAAFLPLPSALPQVQGGRLRLLAVGSKARVPVVPEVPTVQEAGFAGYEADTWHGLAAPAGTPAAIVAKLNAEVARALALAPVREDLAKQGAVPANMTPQQFKSFIQSEVAKYAKVISEAHIQIE